MPLKTRCIIVLAGAIDIRLSQIIKDDDYIIAVDGGIDHLQNDKITPHIVIGDFDSALNSNVKCKTIKYDKQKDETDFVNALAYAKQNFPKSEKVIIGFNSLNRIDHVLGNLSIIDTTCTFISNNQMVTLIENNEMVIAKSEYKYISFFAIEEVIEFSLCGFKYELDKYNLKPFDPLCVSNEIVNQFATINKSAGKVLIIQSKDN